jgi:3-deoxy-D-manno-octulosonic-acid transferase
VGGGFGNPESTTYLNQLLSPNRYWSKLFSFCGSYSFSQHGRMHLCFNKTELIAAFKDLIVDTNYRSEKDICSTFVQMNKGQRALL